MAAIPARVEDLEGTVKSHSQILYGPPGCPDDGLVNKVKSNTNDLTEIGKLLAKQTFYNAVLVFVASAIGLSVITFMFAILTHAVEIVH
jgi:hypothetical protein